CRDALGVLRRESSETEKEQEAKRILKQTRGRRRRGARDRAEGRPRYDCRARGEPQGRLQGEWAQVRRSPRVQLGAPSSLLRSAPRHPAHQRRRDEVTDVLPGREGRAPEEA